MTPADLGFPTKACRECRTVKPASGFSTTGAKKSYRLRSVCKQCRNKILVRWRLKRTEIQRQEKRVSNQISRARCLYGLELDEYQRMLQQPCGICGAWFDNAKLKSGHGMHIDHDHATGKVRGTLCSLCNKGLGTFKNDIDRLKKAIAYLRRSRR